MNRSGPKTPMNEPSHENGAMIQTYVNEHYGDNMIMLSFPKTWKIQQVKMAGHNMTESTDAQIRNALAHPIGTQTIGELANGKKGRIVITCDDLSRPTPAYRVFPFIMEELNKAGISDSQILILGANGSHSPMTIDDFARKVGWDMVARFNCVSHNMFWNNVDLGKTSRGTPILLNKAWVDADLRIAVCGIKRHDGAGAGGSGKAVIPGVASIESLKWNHDVIGTAYKSMWLTDCFPPAQQYWVIKGNEMRADMQEAARTSELGITVNCNYNGRRDLVGLHVGDLDDAWHEAVRFGYKIHSTVALKEKVDIVVLNCYPEAWGDYGLSIDWSIATDALREGGSAVAIAFRPWGTSFVHYYREVAGQPPLAEFFRKKPNPTIPQAGQTIIYTNKLVRRSIMQYSDRVQWLTEWSEVIKRLKAVHDEDATMAFYPCASIQFDPEKLPLKL